MKMFALALCACLGVSTAATAQGAADIAEQYSAARGVFLPGGFDILEQRVYIRDLLTTLQGDWLPAALATQGAAELEVKSLTGFCERGKSVRFDSTKPYQFTLTRVGQVSPLTETFDFVFGQTFQKRVDDAEFITAMKIDVTRPRLAASQLQGANRFGPVTIFQPSPDIFVIFPVFAGTAQIYARCP